MNRLINIALAFCMGLSFLSCNEETEATVPATELINLTFTTFQGSITLNWEYSEGENTNRCVEIRYYDPVKGKNIMKTVSGGATSFTISGTRKEDGEYTFSLQPFSTTFTPGMLQTVSGISKNETGVDWVPMELTADAILGIADDTGEYKTKSNPSILFDKETNSALLWNWYYSENPVYNIDIALPKSQTHLKFGYCLPVSATLRAPSEIQCLVKATAESSWTELTTLTRTVDQLPCERPADPTITYLEFTSGEYKAPSAFNYIRLRIEKVSEHKGDVFTEEFRPRNPNISELIIYDVFYKEEE